MITIYISGPIAGYPAFKEVFESAAKYLRFLHFDVVNPVEVPPHEHEGECPPSYTQNGVHSAACYLRGDLKALLDCDAILMLSGWENSVGARLEHSVAAHCGLKIYYAGHKSIDRKGK
jgi:predicted anti-sigma-YlaC factor YlaD